MFQKGPLMSVCVAVPLNTFTSRSRQHAHSRLCCHFRSRQHAHVCEKKSGTEHVHAVLVLERPHHLLDLLRRVGRHFRRDRRHRVVSLRRDHLATTSTAQSESALLSLVTTHLPPEDKKLSGPCTLMQFQQKLAELTIRNSPHNKETLKSDESFVSLEMQFGSRFLMA